MRKILLILFSATIFINVYGRDPEISLKLDVALPSIIYFSKVDSMSKAFLFPYIKIDTMNKIKIITDPYKFDELYMIFDYYKNKILYTVNARRLIDSIINVYTVNSASVGIQSKKDDDFFLNVTTIDKTYPNAKSSLTNLELYKNITWRRIKTSVYINEFLQRKTDTRFEILFEGYSEIALKLKGNNNIYGRVGFIEKYLWGEMGYYHKNPLYIDIYLGNKYSKKLITPVFSGKLYIHKGFIKLFYYPEYRYKSIFNLTDTLQNLYSESYFYKYYLNYNSGILIKKNMIYIYSSFAQYESFPYVVSDEQPYMSIFPKFYLLYSYIKIDHITRKSRISIKISNNYKFKKVVEFIPDFNTSIYFEYITSSIKIAGNTRAGINYFDNKKIEIRDLHLKLTLEYRFNKMLCASLYGNYTPYYNVYGENFSIPCNKYGIRITLNVKGL
jgi:hypothetical protein